MAFSTRDADCTPLPQDSQHNWLEKWKQQVEDILYLGALCCRVLAHALHLLQQNADAAGVAAAERQHRRLLHRIRPRPAPMHTSYLIIHAIPAKRGKLRPADKLQVKAAKFLPLVGLARSRQDPINRGHGVQYL